LEDLDSISLKSSNKVSISSTCTVFAQQEIISRLSEGAPLEDILAGIHDAIASRVARMVERLKVEPDVVLTGGVAKNAAVAKALEEKLSCKILVPQEPLLSGAIGAALLSKEIIQKAQERCEPILRKQRRLDEATFFK
jgi:predicted CoA-substrate-specific enzyme activase